MTYRDILEGLKELSEQQLDMKATVCLSNMSGDPQDVDEYYPIKDERIAGIDNDVLVEGYPYFIIGFFKTHKEKKS
jgi:hypothetical protein